MERSAPSAWRSPSRSAASVAAETRRAREVRRARYLVATTLLACGSPRVSTPETAASSAPIATGRAFADRGKHLPIFQGALHETSTSLSPDGTILAFTVTYQEGGGVAFYDIDRERLVARSSPPNVPTLPQDIRWVNDELLIA